MRPFIQRPQVWRRARSIPATRFVAVLIVLLAIADLGVPHTGEGQQAANLARIGFLAPSSPSDEPRVARYLQAFRQGLRELGYVEGQNFVLEFRWAEGQYDRLPALAAELVRLKVNIIVASGLPAIQAAKNATETIPIVMGAVADPVATGFVASLARPGGSRPPDRAVGEIRARDKSQDGEALGLTIPRALLQRADQSHTIGHDDAIAKKRGVELHAAADHGLASLALGC